LLIDGQYLLFYIKFYELFDECTVSLAGAAGSDTRPLPRGLRSLVWVVRGLTLLGALASLPGILLGLLALWHLWRLFGEYAAGRVFGRPAQQHIKAFAWCMLASALLAPLQRAAIGVALTLGNPPGERLLALSVSWSDYVAILCGAVLLAIAVVMSQAGQLAEENDGFV